LLALLFPLCALFTSEEGLLPKQIHYFFEHYFKVSDPPARLKADENTIVSSAAVSLEWAERATIFAAANHHTLCLTIYT
jgi:hypothetical protein